MFDYNRLKFDDACNVYKFFLWKKYVGDDII